MANAAFGKIATCAAVAALALCLAGCSSSQESSSSGPDYADDEAMQVIADGWEQRQDLGEDISELDDNYAAELKTIVQAEIDNDAPLKSREFEDGQMQEDVIAYLNALDDQLDVLNSYSTNDLDFYTEWEKAYDERSQLLKTFVEDYGLTVDAKYQDYLDDLVANGTAAQRKSAEKDAIEDIVSKAEWESEDDGYGYYTYTAVIENTSDYDFEDVGLLVGLYDDDDVKTEEYASVNSWKKGEKAKFEVYASDVDAKRIEVEVDYYAVADDD